MEPHLLRRGLLDNVWVELPISSQHTVAAGDLQNIHKDPFDRLLLTQAITEDFTLLTADELLALYQGPIRQV